MMFALLKGLIFTFVFCSFSNGSETTIQPANNEVKQTCKEAECKYICKAMKCLNLDIQASNRDWVYDSRDMKVNCKVPLSCYGNIHIDGIKRRSKSTGRLNCESKACRDGEFVFENLWEAKVGGPVQESFLNFKRVMNVDITATDDSEKDDFTMGTGWSMNTIYATDVHTFKLEAVNGAADASIFQLAGVKEFKEMSIWTEEHRSATGNIQKYIKPPTTPDTPAKIDIKCTGPDSCSGSFFFVSKCSPPMTLSCTRDACGFVTIMVMKNDGDNKPCTKDTFELTIKYLTGGTKRTPRNKIWLYFEDEETWERHQGNEALAKALRNVSPTRTKASLKKKFTIMGPEINGPDRYNGRTIGMKNKRGFHGCPGLKLMGEAINEELIKASAEMKAREKKPMEKQKTSQMLSIPKSAMIGLSFEGAMMSILQAAITHPLTAWQAGTSAATYLSGFALAGPTAVAAGAMGPGAVIPLIIVGVYLTVVGIQNLVLWIRRMVREHYNKKREDEIARCSFSQGKKGVTARQEMINLYGDVTENDEYGQRVRDYRFDEDGRIIEYDMFNNGQAVTQPIKYSAVQLVFDNAYAYDYNDNDDDNNEEYVGTNGQQSAGYEYNPRYYEVNANGYDYDEIGDNGNYYEPYSNGNALNALMILLPVVGFCCTFFLLCSILACCVGGLACFKDKIVGFVDDKNKERHYDEVSDAV